ncbi:hypothetical protein Csa_014410 [Cucumis sativus]|uniref:Uncharacterized protein n=1 Tax=Cucumis sativus TaxID=3659 RepID=A0A0A0KSZ7_CUCSA|nr:hypothetical protein Csa_014410 [Cucumis sativus]
MEMMRKKLIVLAMAVCVLFMATSIFIREVMASVRTRATELIQTCHAGNDADCPPVCRRNQMCGIL